MKKLATIPHGSRLYGTYTVASDWDWKIITLPAIEDMLAGMHLRNEFFTTGSQQSKNNSDDTDIEHIPLQIFAKDFLEGQPYALELAFGILQRNAIPKLEIHEPLLIRFVEELVSIFLTSNVHKMVGYAYNQSQLYSNKGDRLDKLHQFRQFMLDAVQNPPSVFSELPLSTLLEMPRFGQLELLFDKTLFLTTITDPNQRDIRCISVMEKMYPDTISIREAIDRVSATIDKYGARANKAREEKGNDWKALSHAIRIVLQAHEILDNGYLRLPKDIATVTYLKSVKNGEVAREVIQEDLIRMIDAIPVKQTDSSLPSRNAELNTSFNLWLRHQLLDFYKVSV